MGGCHGRHDIGFFHCDLQVHGFYSFSHGHTLFVVIMSG